MQSKTKRQLRTRYRNQWGNRAARAELRRLKDRPCKDCGGIFPYYVMEFDHVRGKKLHDVGHMRRHTPGRIRAEAAKCDLVCSNCHRIRTFKRMKKLGQIPN
jgi:hypothetical protein